MSETSAQEKPSLVKGQLVFLPFMCENAPRFKDIDTAVALMPAEGVKHKQREVWKMMPKMENGKVVRDSDGYMIMVRVVTRNSKVVTVKNEGGLKSFLANGAVEPMDHTDVLEVINILKKQ